MTLVVLGLYARYFSGWGPPAATRGARQKYSRSSAPSAQIWRAAIPAMGFGIIALIALRLLSPSVMPVRTPSIPISFSVVPFPTVIGALLSIVAIAGVTEEMAFRGYMQKPLEEVYGIVPALLIVGTMFWIAHLDHGITVTHLPFQMSASIALGLLAYLTRSLNTSNGRTCRGRRSSCAVLFLSSARICLESIIGAADLGRCRLDVFRETLEHLHCDGSAKHVCRQSISRLCHDRVGFPAERRAHDIRLYQSGTGKPLERSIDACATLEWSAVPGECFAG